MDYITDFLGNFNLEGIIIGLLTFLIIGIYHPLVIKGEYYFGEKIKWAFLLSGVLFLTLSLFINETLVSILLGVAAFSSFWGIKEVKEQTKRVEKGWFPANPKRKVKNKKESNQESFS